MSRDIYNPTVYVGDMEIKSWSSINFKDKGKNQVSSLSVSTSDPQYDNMSLHGKEITFYLNYGAQDTIPFFRGRIRSTAPSNKAFTITAYDCRTFLTGKDSLPISITNTQNYDGYTLGQFLYEYIDTIVNSEETLIGLDMLNDSNPTVSLSGYRADDTYPLKVIQDNLKTNKDSITDIKNTRIIMRDDGYKSNICFVEEQSKTNSGIEFTYSDGIENVSFKRRPVPNVFLAKSAKNSTVYKHNNLPTGVISHKLKGEFNYPDEAIQEAFHVGEYLKDKYELSITVNKGHYLDLGNIVALEVPDYEYLSGKHRIISKTLTISQRKMSCKLGLSKEGPVLSSILHEHK